MTFADSAAALDSQLAAWDEAVDPGTVVIKLDAQESTPLACALVLKSVKRVQNAQGQVSRIQPAIVDIRAELIPEWANEDSLPGEAALIINGKTFHVSEAQTLGPQLHITAFRWPDDSD